jgi:hypothetical protein
LWHQEVKHKQGKRIGEAWTRTCSVAGQGSVDKEAYNGMESDDAIVNLVKKRGPQGLLEITVRNHLPLVNCTIIKMLYNDILCLPLQHPK